MDENLIAHLHLTCMGSEYTVQEVTLLVITVGRYLECPLKLKGEKTGTKTSQRKVTSFSAKDALPLHNNSKWLLAARKMNNGCISLRQSAGILHTEKTCFYHCCRNVKVHFCGTSLPAEGQNTECTLYFILSIQSFLCTLYAFCIEVTLGELFC